MRELDHVALSATVRQIILIEKMGTQLGNLIGALQRDGVPDIAIAGCIEARAAIKRDVDRWKHRVARDWRDAPVVAWAHGVHGLGDAITLVLGVAPPLDAFATVSKLWKYAGFAPGQKAKKGEKLNFSPTLKAFMTVRIADPCIKQRACPYRSDYDARRLLTAITHPEWTDGHSHNDARRIVAKAVLRDMWLVAHGKQAKIDRPETAAISILIPNLVVPSLSGSEDIGEAEAIGDVTPIPCMPPFSPNKPEAANGPLKPIYRMLPSPDDGREGHYPPDAHNTRAPLSRRRSSHIMEPV